MGQFMDLGIIGAIALIVVWAVATFRFEAPGWVHLLLSAGVFLLIFRIVMLGTATRRGAVTTPRDGRLR